MAARMEKAHQQTVAEVKQLSRKTEDALGLASEALERVKALVNSLLTRWETVILVVAVVGAAVMLGLGLSLLIRP
ncbi:hypothetical protein ACFLYE_01535 [Chloroflexota bacterium]